MTTIYLPLIGDDYSVSRACQRQVAEAVVKHTGLPGFNVVFEENLGAVRNTESFDGTAEKEITTDTRDTVFVSAVESFDEMALMTQPTSLFDRNPIILDENIGLAVKTLFIKTAVQLSLRIRFSSVSKMNTWKRQMHMAEKAKPLSYKLSLTYDYALPRALGAFVGHVHKLQEEMEGYGRTLKEYVAEILNTPYRTRTNLNNSYNVLAVAETQKNVVAMFDSEMFYNESTNEEGIYEISAVFKYTYEQPSHVVCKIPLVVHNQMIDDYFIENWVRRGTEDPEVNSEASSAIDKYEPRKVQSLVGGGKRLFDFDDWAPKNPVPGTKTLFIMPLQVDVNDPTLLFDVNEIEDEYLKPAIKNYLSQAGEGSTAPFMNPYMVEVFSLTDKERSVGITEAGNGIYRSTAPLSVRKRYYLRISALMDHMALPNEIVRAFLKTEELAVGAVSGLLEEVVVSTKFMFGALHKTTDGTISERSYNYLILRVKETSNTLKETNNRPIAASKLDQSVPDKSVDLSYLEKIGIDGWIHDTQPDLYQKAIQSELTVKELYQRTGVTAWDNLGVDPTIPNMMKTVMQSSITVKRG